MGTKKATSISRGIEILLRKAAVDLAFRPILIAEREHAAESIALVLSSSEKAILSGIPAESLDRMIEALAREPLPETHRRAFLGQAAAAMLAIVAGGAMEGCAGPEDRSEAPPEPPEVVEDIPETIPVETIEEIEDDPQVITLGERIDLPPPSLRKIRRHRG